MWLPERKYCKVLQRSHKLRIWILPWADNADKVVSKFYIFRHESSFHTQACNSFQDNKTSFYSVKEWLEKVKVLKWFQTLVMDHGLNPGAVDSSLRAGRLLQCFTGLLCLGKWSYRFFWEFSTHLLFLFVLYSPSSFHLPGSIFVSSLAVFPQQLETQL